VPFAAPNANDLFVWLSPYLYASTNGGITWSRHEERTLVPAGIGSNAQNLSNMDFISGRYGWYDLVGTFDYTTDGGRHWTPLGH
jgi:photosystem II stability/assembly factor-like uncharacterized protein